MTVEIPPQLFSIDFYVGKNVVANFEIYAETPEQAVEQASGRFKIKVGKAYNKNNLNVPAELLDKE
jgi:hypothetical protein